MVEFNVGYKIVISFSNFVFNGTEPVKKSLLMNVLSNAEC